MGTADLAASTSVALDVKSMSVTASSGTLDARLYRRAGQGRTLESRLMVFFHGGGFVGGDLDSIDPCMRDMAANLPCGILASTYSQAPEQPFPAAAEDAYAVIAECAKHPRRYGWNGEALIVGGVEAGGNLAAVAALMARDRCGPSLAGQVLMMPMLDPGLSSGSMNCVCPDGSDGNIASLCAQGYRDYLPRASDRTHPYASPLVSTRLKQLPRTFIVSVKGDPLAGEADVYRDKLKASGVEVDLLCLDRPDDTELVGDAATRCRASTDARFHDALRVFVAR